MDKQLTYELWINNVNEDERKAIQNYDEMEKQDAFGSELEFGTAGIRGIMGLGPNRLNQYTIARVTEAVAISYEKPNCKFAISFDTRENSRSFAWLAARILARHGISVILADSMPTPYLSFMVRYFHCDGGIMITASHNPKEYNGYKVYDSTGCQILPEVARKITDTINSLPIFDVVIPDQNTPLPDSVTPVSPDCTAAFYSAIEKYSCEKISDITVLYSALNGTGINLIPTLLSAHNIRVELNSIQCLPDPNFTTCPSPNPEKAEVCAQNHDLARKVNADLILCSDPDSDRLGVDVAHQGKFVHLTGNEIGVLLSYHLLSNGKTGYIMRSIVSTPLVDKLAEHYGAQMKLCLTGFKYIGEFLNELSKENRTQEFLFGFEESSGYLAGDYIREKDATIASLLICELASICKKANLTLVDKLNEIYSQFGKYTHKVISLKLKPTQKSKEIMQKLRKIMPQNNAITQIVDYSTSQHGLPPADMLEFNIDGVNVFLRPSGTEPLIKAYLTVIDSDENTLKKATDTLTNILNNI
ncbi:MAG: phospho-sugar mutase [Clostridia bacterium]|nr:phospho-sugar mutase [Clostridia bacterium]